jgi:chromosome segregation ATPase
MRELKNLNDQLSQMQKDFHARLRVVSQGETRFVEKQKQTVEYLSKFKSYIQDADLKRVRAERRIQEERRAITETDAEMEALHQRLALAKSTLQSQHKKLRQFHRYREYLARVVQHSGHQYTDVEHMLAGLQSLVSAHTLLMGKLQSLSGSIGELQEGLARGKQERDVAVLARHRELASLLARLDATSEKTWAPQPEPAETSSGSMQLLSRLQLSIRSLYQRCKTSYPVESPAPAQRPGANTTAAAARTTGSAAAATAGPAPGILGPRASPAAVAAARAHLQRMLAEIRRVVREARELVDALRTSVQGEERRRREDRRDEDHWV